jgi:hypothetical protein
MDRGARPSDSPPAQLPAHKFGSLSHALAYIDNVQERIGSLDGGELLDALKHLDYAYDEFPELELDRPRNELLEGLRLAAENMLDRAAIPLLTYCVTASPSSSSSLASLVEKIIKSDYWRSLSGILGSLCCGGESCWRVIEPVTNVLRQKGQTETVLRLISEVLGCAEFAKEHSASDFGDVLKLLLSDPPPLEINSLVLARAVRSARRRLSRPSHGRSDATSREVLLAMAERLSPTTFPVRLSAHPDLAWPSSRMSFDEFLLQWPCEVELSVELDDATFIDEAFRAILLRAPEIAERNQYLRLLHDGVAAKSWIIEDLLSSNELRSLERRVRVICEGQVITEPGNSREEETPAVTLPWKPAD